jgi:RimJ/RimL family protein N-acetyltransferase
VHLLLRDVADSDLPVFFVHQADPESVELAGVPPRDAKAFAEHWAEVRNDPEVVTRTIVVDGQVAGRVVCFRRDGRRELGYWVGREHWGRGIGQAAVTAFLASYDVRPLAATVSSGNEASLRILASCGFLRTGEAAGVVSLRLD